jgi:iron complex outermembrane receptor protein
MGELFGDGGAQKSNPELDPERGRYADGGVVWSDSFGPVCIVFEGNGFLSRVDDKIVLVTTNQGQSKAENYGHADVRGVELGGDLSYLRTLRVVSAATFMETSGKTTNSPNEKARQLPRQPKLRAYARAEASAEFPRLVDRLTLFASVNHDSTAYYDKANESLRAPQTFLEVGSVLALYDGRVELSARVTDLLDTRGQDFLGFPLPGRAFFVMFSYREETQ